MAFTIVLRSSLVSPPWKKVQPVTDQLPSTVPPPTSQSHRILMAPPSDPSIQEAAARKQNKKAPFKFLVPLVYAPVLPLIRLSLRHRPVLRDRLFTAVLAGAFVHGFYLVTDLYDIESK